MISQIEILSVITYAFILGLGFYLVKEKVAHIRMMCLMFIITTIYSLIMLNIEHYYKLTSFAYYTTFSGLNVVLLIFLFHIYELYIEINIEVTIQDDGDLYVYISSKDNMRKINITKSTYIHGNLFNKKQK